MWRFFFNITFQLLEYERTQNKKTLSTCFNLYYRQTPYTTPRPKTGMAAQQAVIKARQKFMAPMYGMFQTYQKEYIY